ncbi:hypothetical protein BBJ28_00025516 [Nothophytophthora sp. Chile5]|nr:hypothetical protein BBJ28_00025516 [Nothophytophthora sp. Chile5]
MQWTAELNALLNQCVFASGYDFAAASTLFCAQATTLRLDEGEVVLTANQCQEQWMSLNPTVEDDDSDEEYDVSDDVRPEELAEELRSQGCQRNDEDPSLHGLAGLSLESNEANSLDGSRDHDAVVSHDEGVAMLDGAPRLELSLSEAELDQLLSSLPPANDDPLEAGGSEAFSSADAKQQELRPAAVHSEMQWVLAFLTNPDAIASVDAEAKNLMGSPEKHEDDNYQVFLQGLNNANLMMPAPLEAAERIPPIDRQPRLRQPADRSNGNATDEDDDESGSEDDESLNWELTRRAMKDQRAAEALSSQASCPM